MAFDSAPFNYFYCQNCMAEVSVRQMTCYCKAGPMMPKSEEDE